MTASTFFRKFFTSPLEASKTEFFLQNISTNIVQLVVKFVSEKSVNLTESNILDATVAAHYLTLPDLEAYCNDFIIKNFHAADYLVLHSFGEGNNLFLMARRITQAVLENADELFQSDALVSISSEKLAELIASDALVVEREENVWEAVWKWFLHSEDSRYRCLLNLVEYIWFPLLELHSLEKIKTLLSSTRHDLLSSRLGSIMKEAEGLVRSPYRSFTYSHPKYRLRDRDYQKFELAITERISYNPLTKTTRQLPPLFPADVDNSESASELVPMANDRIRFRPERLLNSTDGTLIAHACITTETSRQRQHWFKSYFLRTDQWEWERGLGDRIPPNDYAEDTYHFPVPRCRKSKNHRYDTVLFGVNNENEWRLIVEIREEPTGFYHEISRVPLPFHVPGGWPFVLAYGDHVFVFHCSHLQPNDPLQHRRTFRWTQGESEWIELAPSPHTRYLADRHEEECLNPMKVRVTPLGRFVFAEPTAKRSTHNFFEVYDVEQDSWSTIVGPLSNLASRGNEISGLNGGKSAADVHETSWFFTLYKAKLILFETEVVDVENKLFQTKVNYHDGRDQWSEGEMVEGIPKASNCVPFSTI